MLHGCAVSSATTCMQCMEQSMKEGPGRDPDQTKGAARSATPTGSDQRSRHLLLCCSSDLSPPLEQATCVWHHSIVRKHHSIKDATDTGLGQHQYSKQSWSACSMTQSTNMVCLQIHSVCQCTVHDQNLQFWSCAYYTSKDQQPT